MSKMTKLVKFIYIAVVASLCSFSSNVSLAEDAKKGLQFAVNGEYRQAVDIWLPLAEEGDAEAQYYMGVVYKDGLGVEINYDQFRYWTSRSAFQGSPSAMFNLGIMYEYSLGVNEDKNKAFLWYSRAAQEGDVEASVRAGRMIRGDDFLCEDQLNCDYIVEYYYRPAAEQANTEAMVYMANIFLIQRSYIDSVEALGWLLIAQELGIRDQFLQTSVAKIIDDFRDKEVFPQAKLFASSCKNRNLKQCNELAYN